MLNHVHRNQIQKNEQIDCCGNCHTAPFIIGQWWHHKSMKTYILRLLLYTLKIMLPSWISCSELLKTLKFHNVCDIRWKITSRGYKYGIFHRSWFTHFETDFNTKHRWENQSIILSSYEVSEYCRVPASAGNCLRWISVPPRGYQRLLSI